MFFANFVHLHLHSHYSFLDSSIRIGDLIATAKKHRMSAIALTDHGNLHGAIDFFEKSRKAGIKSIIGCELYVAATHRADRERPLENNSYHLPVLASSDLGYKNLVKLVSRSNLEGFHHVPRVDMELLGQYAQGLICLSGCKDGQIPRLILENKIDAAMELAEQYRALFGRENFYFEVQRHFVERENLVNEGLFKMSRMMNIPLVATNDCHFTHADDHYANEVLNSLKQDVTFNDPSRIRYYNAEYYMKSPEEMTRLFADHPEAIKNTIRIADRCSAPIPLDKIYLPVYRSPEKGGQSSEGYLEAICRQFIPSRFREWTDVLEQRFQKELRVITQKGFADYFLITWDFIRYAREHGVPVGPGRGSAAGSLLAYLLRITDIDPLKYDLLFERFLNPERVSMPDMDIDFSDQSRDQVIQYVIRKYGEENVTAIATFGQMKAKTALRDVARVFGLPLTVVNHLAELVGDELKVTLSSALRDVPELKNLYDAKPEIKKTIDVARKLEGVYRQTGVHAAGIIISDHKVSDLVPVFNDPKDGKVVTQFEKESVEKVGLLKMDFLGLSNLHTIQLALQYIEQNRGIKLDIDNLEFDDPQTFTLLQTGNTLGVFQLEKEGMRKILVRLKPSVFEDIIALLALYRPGPLGSGMVDTFIQCKHGERKIQFPHPRLEEVLRDTYGVFLYQEQVMRTANVLAGYSLGQSDELRKAMGKKKAEVMEAHRKKFVDGALKNGIATDKATEIFELMAKFAEYGFNKSHSAAYAKVTYQTAYLKAHYLLEFMAAFLTRERKDRDKLAECVRDCRLFGVKILPVDINSSGRVFEIEKGALRFALEGIKGIGENAVENILEVRHKQGPFKTFEDLFRRLDLRVCNSRVIETLARCGALDCFGLRRKQMLAMVKGGIDFGNLEKKNRSRGQFTFQDLAGEVGVEDFTARINVPNLPECSFQELSKFEEETYGFYMLFDPVEEYAEALQSFAVPIATVLQTPNRKRVLMGGIIQGVREITTKKDNKPMAFIEIRDHSGLINLTVMNAVYETRKSMLKAGTLVVIQGPVEEYNEQKKVKIMELYSLSDYLKSRRAEFHLRLSAIPPTSELELLTGQRESFAGDFPLFIWINRGDKMVKIAAGDTFRINPSSRVFKFFQQHYGADNFQVALS